MVYEIYVRIVRVLYGLTNKSPICMSPIHSCLIMLEATIMFDIPRVVLIQQFVLVSKVGTLL